MRNIQDVVLLRRRYLRNEPPAPVQFSAEQERGYVTARCGIDRHWRVCRFLFLSELGGHKLSHAE